MFSTDLWPWMQALLIIVIGNLCVHVIHLVYQLAPDMLLIGGLWQPRALRWLKLQKVLVGRNGVPSGNISVSVSYWTKASAKRKRTYLKSVVTTSQGSSQQTWSSIPICIQGSSQVCTPHCWEGYFLNHSYWETYFACWNPFETVRLDGVWFLMIDRLLLLRSSLTQVLEELEWDNLAVSEWKKLHAIKHLLQPFAPFTQLVSGEEFSTVSYVVPAITDLNLHLEEFKQHPNLQCIRSCTSIAEGIEEAVTQIQVMIITSLSFCWQLHSIRCIACYPTQINSAVPRKNSWRDWKNRQQIRIDQVVQVKVGLLSMTFQLKPQKSLQPRNSATLNVFWSRNGRKVLRRPQKWQEGVKETNSLPPDKAEVKSLLSLWEITLIRVDQEQSYIPSAYCDCYWCFGNSCFIRPSREGFWGHSW